MFEITLPTLGILVIYQTLFYFAALKKEDNSIVDLGWGPGFLLAVLSIWMITSMQQGEFHFSYLEPRQLLLMLITAFWALRLSLHIHIKTRGKSEDFRYAAMRQRWGSNAIWKSYTHVFFLQAIILWFLALPLMLAMSRSGPTWQLTDLAGCLLFATGMIFEALADWQLLRFKRNVKPGKVLDTGLWKYSRHPNYFGEALLWWGIFVLCWPALEDHKWWLILCPLCLTFLLLKVSGIPLVEKKKKNDSEYSDYIRRTNAFIPWKPRR